MINYDIVVRLRKVAEERKEAYPDWDEEEYVHSFFLEDLAADEIERLEDELSQTRLLWNADKAKLEALQNER